MARIGLMNSDDSTSTGQDNADDGFARLNGDLLNWPSKHEMANVLRAAGLTVVVGRYSIRVEDCSHFVFQEYGGDIGKPALDADADSVEQLEREASLVSRALAKAGIVHRFAIYDEQDSLAAFLHHKWPLEAGPGKS